MMTNIVVDKSTDHAKPLSIVTRWCEQRCLYTYQKRQTGQSDCDNNAYCGKKIDRRIVSK